VKPKNPCLLTSARAQSCFSCERDKLERAKNFVASFPEIRPSPSTIQFQISKWKRIVSISNSEVSKIIKKRLTWICQIKPFLIRLCFLFRTRFGLHLRRDSTRCWNWNSKARDREDSYQFSNDIGTRAWSWRVDRDDLILLWSGARKVMVVYVRPLDRLSTGCLCGWDRIGCLLSRFCRFEFLNLGAIATFPFPSTCNTLTSHTRSFLIIDFDWCLLQNDKY